MPVCPNCGVASLESEFHRCETRPTAWRTLWGTVKVFLLVRVELVFQFNDLPQGVSYILSLWGCGLMTLALGYAVAACDPVRHVAWVQVGIARGALECVVGSVYLTQGVVTFQLAGLGIIVAALVTAAYVALYPRGDSGLRPQEL